MILWVLQILVVAMFLFSGGMKLVGAQPMVELFNEIGVGSGSATSPAGWKSSEPWRC